LATGSSISPFRADELLPVELRPVQLVPSSLNELLECPGILTSVGNLVRRNDELFCGATGGAVRDSTGAVLPFRADQVTCPRR
jgi:hypothetical protein